MPLIRTDAWWVRSFDFPRAQIAIVGFVVFVLLYVFLTPLNLTEGILLSVLLFSLGFLVFRIFPYTPFAPVQVESAIDPAGHDTVSLMCANVLQSNRDASKLLQVVAEYDPDLLLAVETDEWWEQTLSALEENYPYCVRHPLDNTYGMLFYSRLELDEAEIKFLVAEDIPSIFARMKLKSGEPVEVICVHPQPPRPDKQQDSTQRDAELLIVAKYVEHVDCPVIVMGDFNDVAWSHTTRLFQRVSGLLDPRRGRGFFNTFHADYPVLRYPLDHVFHSNHFRIVSIQRLSHIGSDHFPVYARLSLEDDAEKVQEVPETDEEDQDEAKKMIRKAFESDD